MESSASYYSCCLRSLKALSLRDLIRLLLVPPDICPLRLWVEGKLLGVESEIGHIPLGMLEARRLSVSNEESW
jgi:hypothetical protein